MSRAWNTANGREWRRIRADVLLANANTNRGRCALNVGRVCQRHGKPCPGICTGTANQVHHARGKAFGDDPRFLVAACKECNLHVGDPTRVSPEPQPKSKW
jgi:hypothetical protein